MSRHSLGRSSSLVGTPFLGNLENPHLVHHRFSDVAASPRQSFWYHLQDSCRGISFFSESDQRAENVDNLGLDINDVVEHTHSVMEAYCANLGV